MRQVVNICIIALFLIAGAANAQEASKPKPVEVARPERGTISQELSYTGSLEANAQVEVSANRAGKIVDLKVDEGDRVKKGDVLALTDSTELLISFRQSEAALKAAQAKLITAEAVAEISVKSQVASAKAALDSAKTQLERAKALSYTQAKMQLDQAEANLAVAQANLKKAQDGSRQQEKEQVKAAVDQAKVSLNYEKLNFERIKRLYENGAVSKQNFDGAKAQYDRAKAQYNSAMEQLSLVEEGLRAEDIAIVESQLSQAKAALELAKLTFTTKDWEKSIALAQSQFNQAEAAFLSAKVLEDTKSWEREIEIARTQVTQAEENYSLSKKRLDDATITSPIDGIISMRVLDIGDYAQSAGAMNADPLYTIVNMDIVKAVFEVPESDLDNIKAGDTVSITTASGRKDIAGKIGFISPIVNSVTRKTTVKATIPNPGYNLKPGMFVEIKIKTLENKNALLLSRGSVLNIQDNNGHVFVAENGKAVQRKVKVGMRRGEYIEVVDGISDTAAVIVGGHHSLHDGANISIVTK